MAVRIRLTRRGGKMSPFYRIVVADRESSRDGQQIEVLGHYDPKKGVDKADFKLDRIQHWIAKGATPSDIVKRILKKTRLKQAAA